jgi:hypothetical protein
VVDPYSASFRRNHNEEPPGYIDQPSLADVLCGKGGEANNHEGNKRYLMLVEVNKEKYRNLGKGNKKMLSQLVVQWVNRNGRFLKKSFNDRWYEIDHASALSKVSKAFREAKIKGFHVPLMSAPTTAARSDNDEEDEDDDDEQGVELPEPTLSMAPQAVVRSEHDESMLHCDLIIPPELSTTLAIPPPPGAAAHPPPPRHAMYMPPPAQLRASYPMPPPPPMPAAPHPIGMVSGPTSSAPTVVSDPSLQTATPLTVVNAYCLMADGLSRVPTTLCVPTAAQDLYANQIVVPLSIISRLELRAPVAPNATEQPPYNPPYQGFAR